MTPQNDFIEVYENAYSPEYCAAVIDYFNHSEEAGYTMTRQSHEGPNIRKLTKDDSLVFLNGDQTTLNLFTTVKLSREFNDLFWSKHYKEYADKYAILAELEPHSNPVVKIQKTLPGGGYHIWHCEVNGMDSARRILVWTLYLNDDYEGGETEFLYQHKRIKPKTGSLVIWPAGFTHVHRGNPPLSGVKYIVTGWIEF